MQGKPSITIGIMTRNYGHYIRQAVDSVVAQGRADWELVISDDASTDGTPDIVRPYLRDPRIRYVRHEKNLGQAGNWSYLLTQGDAERLAILHADDYWLPEFLENTLAPFEGDPEVDMVYTNWWRDWLARGERVVANDTIDHKASGIIEYGRQARRMTFHVSATLLSRRAIIRAGLPNPELRMVVDYEYLLRCALSSRRVRAVETPLMVYRAHEANATVEGTANGELANEKEELIALGRRHELIDPRAKQYQAVLKRNMAGAIFSMGVTAGANGDLSTGRELMRRGARLDPGMLTQAKCGLDLALAACGARALPLFTRIHRNRILA